MFAHVFLSSQSQLSEYTRMFPLTPGLFFFPFDSFLPFYFLFLAGRGGRESLQSIIQRREVVLCPTVKEGKREPFDSLFMFRLHVLLF